MSSWSPLGDGVRSVVRLVEALDESVARCTWSVLCTCCGHSNVCADGAFSNVRPFRMLGGFGGFVPGWGGVGHGLDATQVSNFLNGFGRGWPAGLGARRGGGW